MVRPKDAVPDIGDRELASDFQARVMESIIHLAGLYPNGPADPRHPLAAGLIGRFMDVTATAEQRLVLLMNFRRVGEPTGFPSPQMSMPKPVGGWWTIQMLRSISPARSCSLSRWSSSPMDGLADKCSTRLASGK
jgi:hypothetical protein